MPRRIQILIASIILLAGSALVWAARFPNGYWMRFDVFLAVILMSSGLKVVLPQGEGSMSLNFPFILLAVVQLSPMQAMLLAAISVAAQCRLRVKKLFTAVQIVFNIANSVSATAVACITYRLLTHRGMGSAPALSLASVSYFLASTIPVANAIAISKNERAFLLWKNEFPWYLPFYFVGAVLAAVADGVGQRFGPSTSLLLIPMVYTIYRAYTAQIVRARERQQHLEETEALHLRTIEALAMAIEAKDQETHEHLFRVRNYVTAVGKELALSKLEMNALHTAAFLHDIGKLAVPEHIINKPGRLSPAEFETMKIHPVVGADILDRVRFPYPVVPIVRSHHEWWDGQGYPDGLKGEQIPIGARILTVVDCFDALTSDRPYRKGKAVGDAMAIVRELSGTQFDPAIVDVFERLCYTLEKQDTHEERVFIPLNLEIDVRRGLAPGAGFEEQNETPGEPVSHLADDGGGGEVSSKSSLYAVGAGREDAQTLFALSQSAGRTLSLQDLATILALRLRRLVPFDCCALYLREGNMVVLRHVDGVQEANFSIEPIALGEGISGWVAQSGKAILNGNATVEPSYHVRPGQQEILRSALSTPLFDAEREVFGVLTLYALAADSFSKDHLRIVQAMEPKVSLALQNIRLSGRDHESAETDPVTNLPNARQLFVQLETELQRCGRNCSSLAVIVCELGSMQQVIDADGPVVGNKVLSKIADRFREGCRTYDTVARTGADEFAFLLPDINDGEDLSQRLCSIEEMVKAAKEECGVRTALAVRLGSCFFPEDGTTAEDLLALADRRKHLRQTDQSNDDQEQDAERTLSDAV